MEKLYTIAETAEQMRCSPHTVRRRIKAGELKFVRNGRKYLITQSAIDEFFSGTNQSDTAEPMPLKEESAQLPAEPTESRAAPLPDSWKK